MEISTQVFSFEYYEIFKNIFFEEHLRTAASVIFSLNFIRIWKSHSQQGFHFAIALTKVVSVFVIHYWNSEWLMKSKYFAKASLVILRMHFNFLISYLPPVATLKENKGWVTYWFSYAIHHNDARGWTLSLMTFWSSENLSNLKVHVL